MKVALIHDHLGGIGGGGGGIRQMIELARGLQTLGAEVVVVVHDHDRARDQSGVADEFEVRAVRVGTVAPQVGQRQVLRRLFVGMRRVADLVPGDVDVINAHEHPGLHAGQLASRRLDVPLVWTRNDDTLFERGLFPTETTYHPGSWKSRLAHIALSPPDFFDGRRAARVVVLDRGNARMVERAYRRSATVVRSGPHPRFFDPPDRQLAREGIGLEDGQTLALGVGILFPHRRFEDLVVAMSHLDERYVCRIVGDDTFEPAYADALESLIATNSLADRVTLVRRAVSDQELRTLYSGADVFVFPNERQTWGLAPLEALASGTPAVVSRGAGVHEVLQGRPGVAVVPERSPAEIAAAVAAAASEQGRAGVAETRAWIREELNQRRYGESMLQLFEEIVG